MDENENLMNSKVREDLINNLIQTEFISLNKEDLSKYNCEDILKESLNTIKNLKNDLTNIEKDKIPIETNKKEENNISNKERKLSTSSTDSITSKEIPKKYLENPIDFVNYLEYELPTEKINKVKDKFLIKQYEENNDIKFDIVNITTDKEINRIIYTINEIITSIYFYGKDFLITGNIFGKIKIYSLIDKKQIKQIECPILNENNNIKVTSMDMSKDNQILFIGYSSGAISLAEIKSKKIKLVINDIIKNSECLCIKFIEKEAKCYIIIVSDQIGNIYLIKIKDGFTGCKVTESKIILANKEQKNNPIYFIKLLEFNEDISKKNSFLKNINKYIIFGSLKDIGIYSLINNSELNLKYRIEKPDYIKDYVISDICFGLGKHPQSREDLDDNEDEPQILLCACFDNIINLYMIPIDNHEITFPILIGHYLNINEDGNNLIIRIGFLAKGCIYLIDKSNNFKILNTKKFIKGSPNIKEGEISMTNKINLMYKKTEINKIYKFNKEITYQINIMTPKKNFKQSYMNSVVQNFITNNIAVLCNNNLYIIDLVRYEDYLKQLQKDKKWIELFILGIDIYKGLITCFKGIPHNSEERKNKLRDYLLPLISIYIIEDDMNQQKEKKELNNNYYQNQKFIIHTENKIEMIIEFCMEIEGFNFLLDSIMKIYESKKFGDLFFSKLESFIICDKLLKYEINEDLLIKLIQIYEEKNKINKLNKLLLHIDIKSLCSKTVKEKIKELNLFSPMMTIYINAENPDYFKPVLLLYEKYATSEKLNFFSYEKIIEKKTLNEIQESKEYKGHKLFWYINKSFIRRKYPYFINTMEENEYNKYIIDLLFWLMKENIMNDLIKFNSELYFDIFNKIFNTEKNLTIIKNLNSNEKEKEAKLNILNKENYNYPYEDLSPLNLFNFIINQGKKIEGEQKMKLDFNLLIIQSYKNISLPKDIIMTSIIFILDVYYIINNKTLDNKIKRIIQTIINILNNTEIFTNSDYENILLHFSTNTHIFDEIKIFIYKKIKKYKNCLELFLDENTLINNKETLLLKYVDEIFHFLEKENGALYLEFKNYVLDNIDKIGEISKDTMIKIIFDYFYSNNQDKKLIMEKLENKPKLQILFIEPLYKEIIIAYKENQKNKIENIIDDDIDFIQLILGKYIKLLCITENKSKILKCLKETDLFPIDYCREICEQYDVQNALTYLYQKSGDYQNALKFSLKMIENNYNEINNNLNSAIFKKKEFNEQINDFNDSVNQSLDILILIEEIENHKKNNLYLSSSDKDWFDILDKLYNISIIFEKIFLNLSSNRKKFGKIFDEALSDNIILILDKMSSYISFQNILEEVSKNKIAGYKEFKPLLNKIFETYDIQSSILLYSNKLFKNLCFENIEEYNEMNKEGNYLDINICNICGNIFDKIEENNDKKILIFNCGHKMHYHCAKIENIKNKEILICPLCKKKEKELDIFNLNETIIKDLTIKEEEKEIKKGKKLNSDNIDIKMYKAGFNRMKDIDKNLINKTKNFFCDCIEAKQNIIINRVKKKSSKKKKKK